MKITHERLVIGRKLPGTTEEEHLVRYQYACQFVANKDVLDIACGSGYGSQVLAEAGARSVRGVDVSSEAIGYAASCYSAPALKFSIGNAEHLSDLPDCSFDIVVSFETIEHVQNVDSYLAEMHRVLRVGGLYIVSTPDRRLASSMYMLRRRPNNQYHVREFTRSEFLRAVRHRFEVRELLGQAFIRRGLVFWPVQAGFKAVCYALQRFGAYKLVQKHYHVGSGLELQTGISGVARFWVIVAVKLN